MGRNLANWILENEPEARVTVVDSLSASKIEDIRDLQSNSRFDFYIGNINDAELVELLLGDKDLVINTALSYGSSDYLDIVCGTQYILERLTPEQRYVHISSYEVYGPYTLYPHMEYNTPNPGSLITSCLVSAEAIVQGHINQYGKNAVILRPCTLFGPRDSQHTTMGEIYTNAVFGFHIEASNTFMELLYIDDFADAVMRAAKSKHRRVFNIGSGKRMSYFDVAQRIVKAMNSSSSLEFDGEEALPVLKYGVISDLAYNMIGWHPTTDVEEALIKTAEWYVRNKQRLSV